MRLSLAVVVLLALLLAACDVDVPPQHSPEQSQAFAAACTAAGGTPLWSLGQPRSQSQVVVCRFPDHR